MQITAGKLHVYSVNREGARNADEGKQIKLHIQKKEVPVTITVWDN